MLNSADYGFPPSYSYDLQNEQPCYDMSKNDQSGPSHMQSLQPTAMSVRVQKILITNYFRGYQDLNVFKISYLFEIVKQNNSLNPLLRGS